MARNGKSTVTQELPDPNTDVIFLQVYSDGSLGDTYWTVEEAIGGVDEGRRIFAYERMGCALEVVSPKPRLVNHGADLAYEDDEDGGVSMIDI